jgi:tripartite-type tricarboxylate transporter receptor subunit TctC
MVHIPFPGAPVAIKEVMAGNVHMLWVTLPAAMGQIRQGLVRAIAVTTERRVGSAPEVPTMTELGYKGYGFGSWQGIFLPPGTPKAIADRLNGEINAVLKVQQLVDSLQKVGFDPVGGSPDLFSRTVGETSTRWGKVVREAGVKPD